MSNSNDKSPIADMFIRYRELDLANYNRHLGQEILNKANYNRVDIDSHNAPLSNEAPDIIDEIVQIAHSDKEYQQDLQKDHK